jgi:hypothetical protein
MSGMKGDSIQKVRMNLRPISRWLPFPVYGLLSLAVLGPLLKPGYILALDSGYSLYQPFANKFFGLDEWYISATLPSDFIISLLNGIMPVWVWQKVALLLIFFLAGIGAHRIFPIKGLPQYYAGILYMINPFTAARFFAGHWGLLAGYAIIPFGIKAFLDLLESGSTRDIIKVVIFTTLAGLIQIHSVFLLLLAYLVLFVARLIATGRDRTGVLRQFKSVGAAAGLFLWLNLYWLVPSLTAEGTIIQATSANEMNLFAPQATSQFGVAFDLASMHGFWRIGYIYSQDLIPCYWLLFLVILYFAISGISSLWWASDRTSESHQAAKRLLIPFVSLGIISLFLAMGAAVDFTRSIYTWVYNMVPFFIGFRDSQKFIALLCLFYSYAGALGLSEITGIFRKKGRLAKVACMAIALVAILTPLAYAFTMFGTNGQLKVTDYPQEWYEANDLLNQDESDFNVLFLPWHHFMDYSWLPNTQKRMGNTTHLFFDKPVISGDNMELMGLYSQSNNPISKYVEFVLDKGNGINNLGELMAPLNVKYVILVNEVDYKLYDFLYRQNDLSIMMQKPGLTLFINDHPTTRVYGVDSAIYIQNLDEYLELSQSQDVMEHLYIMGKGKSDKETNKMEALNFIRESPVRYQIEKTSRKYTIYTVPQNVNTNYWEYNGEKSRKNLGFMPAFASSPGGGELTYVRFYRVYLPSYIVSLLALILILYYLFSGSLRLPSRQARPKGHLLL